MTDYEKRAKDFLKNNNAKMVISFVGCMPYFPEDVKSRNVYRVRIDRDHKTMQFKFGDSIDNTYNNKRPTSYDVLACLDPYFDCSDVWEFASEFGYNIYDRDSYKRAEKTFNACKRQTMQINRVFGGVLEELAEIQ